MEYLPSIILCLLALGICFAIFAPAAGSQWRQFKLRTMLIVITGACILFALVRHFGFERFAIVAFCLTLLVACVAFFYDIYRVLFK